MRTATVSIRVWVHRVTRCVVKIWRSKNDQLMVFRAQHSTPRRSRSRAPLARRGRDSEAVVVFGAPPGTISEHRLPDSILDVLSTLHWNAVFEDDARG